MKGTGTMKNNACFAGSEGEREIIFKNSLRGLKILICCWNIQTVEISNIKIFQKIHACNFHSLTY